MKCNSCNSEMEFKKEEGIIIPVGNPIKLMLKADYYKCINCGKELIPSNEALRIAEEVDRVNDKLEKGEIKTLNIKEGTVFC